MSEKRKICNPNNIAFVETEGETSLILTTPTGYKKTVEFANEILRNASFNKFVKLFNNKKGQFDGSR